MGNEKIRDDGVPGITNYIFSETAARGFYQHWANLLTSKTWQEAKAKTDAYQKTLVENSKETA